MSADEIVAEAWTVSPAGYVMVGGERVRSGHGTVGLVARRTWLATCQRCGGHKIECRLVLMRRFEPALGRLMYWFDPDGSPTPRHCDECAAVIVDAYAAAGVSMVRTES